MDTFLSILTSYWWIGLLIVAAVSYKVILRVFFGLVIIPEDKIGLVTKKFVLFGENKELPDGRIIATKGEAGYQATPLSPGMHWYKWIWQYSVEQVDFTVIPTGKIGLVNAKDGSPLPVGNILSRKVECNDYQDVTAFLTNGGQKGKQTRFLSAGTYRINTNMFAVTITEPTIIPEGKVGVITALDGAPLTPGHIAGAEIDGHKNFQDFDAFLENGGQRGLQPQVIQAGSYYLNPWAVQVELQEMTEVPIGYVGVVISYIGEEGEDVSGDNFKHGNLVKKGQRGVHFEPLGPGKYALNRRTHKIENVPTTNIVLNWADASTEAHKLDSNLSTITVRSNDGFPFNLDVSQIIHIPLTDAPKVIARFGNMQNLVSQVLEPTIGNYFRNSAQKSDVIAFLSERKQRQDDAKEHISKVLEEYNVHAVDTLIGDIVPPAALMKTLTDRKIASEEKKTFEVQKEAQIQRQTLEKETAIAKMQGEIVAATQSVEIANRKADAAVKTAEGESKATELKAIGDAKARELMASADAKAQKLMAEANAEAVKMQAQADYEKISKTGKAQAESIEAQGRATAESYKLQVEAMGKENFGQFKVIEQIAENKVEIMPKLLITGSQGNGTDGPLSGLLGMQLLQMIQKKDSN